MESVWTMCAWGAMGVWSLSAVASVGAWSVLGWRQLWR